MRARNIISMPPNHPPLTPECAALFTYWDRLRCERLLPTRGSVDPGQIRSLLPFISILQSISQSEARFRLAGTGLRDLFGFELTGRNTIDLAPTDHRRTRSYRFWHLLRRPCAAAFTRRITFTCGGQERTHGVILPLAADREGEAPLCIGLEMPDGGPRWVNHRSSQIRESVDSWDFLDIGAGIPEGTVPPDDWPVA